MSDLYALLGVPSDVDFPSLKKAYFRAVKSCHPDLFGGNKAKEAEFKLIVAAFDTLSDPCRRSAYDQKRKAAANPLAEPGSAAFHLESASILDTDADDVLEEIIVGNSLPPGTSLSTLFLDLEHTEVFMMFREAKNLFYSRRVSAAAELFARVVAISPDNILHRYYLGRSLALLGMHGKAIRQYRRAVEIGDSRAPPQELRRIRSELAALEKSHRPWWHAVISLLSPPKAGPTTFESDHMIDETNRAIARLERQKGQERKALGSGKPGQGR